MTKPPTPPAEDRRAAEFISDALTADNYLGNADLVTALVDGFTEKVHGWAGSTAAGELSKGEFKRLLGAEIDRLADIFMGRNPAYTPIVGWNSRFGVAIALRQSLGAFWDMHGASYANDPCKCAFGWLASSLLTHMHEAAADDDADLAGVQMRVKLAQLVRVLLGVHRRG